MTTARIEIPYDEIAAFCRKWKVAELALFGSVLRDDFRPDSDVDVLVTWAPSARWSLTRWLAMQDELSELLGRPVDLVERGAIEESRNPFRRRHILSHAEPIYVA
jgi:predicted nucleotidyltransferase